MKKVLLVLAVVVVSSMVLSSCGSTHGCPAYGKVTKVPAEQRG
jgi:outer membrane murein-binding lipoprotein Lpp